MPAPFESLRKDTAALSEDPHDLSAWHRIAAELARLGKKSETVRALAGLGRAYADTGQAAFALLCIKELAAIAPKEARALTSELAQAYGEGSTRIDPAWKPKPPPPPRPRPPRGAAAAGDVPREAARVVEEAIDTWTVNRDLEGPSRLPLVPLLHNLDEASLAEWVGELDVREEPAGTVVIEQGEEGRSFFLVVSGMVRVARRLGSANEEIVLTHLHSGQFFGEMALLGAAQRTARAVCETPCVLFEATRQAMEKVARRQPKFAAVLAGYCRDRLLGNLFVVSPLFRPLTADERPELMRRFERRMAQAGELLVQEGKEGPGLFVVLGGEVEVRKRDGKDTVVLAKLRPGDVFGEMSLLGRRRLASASVVAVEKSALLYLEREAFKEAMKAFPAARERIDEIAADRERATAEILAAQAVPADELIL